jgi:RNA polymerase sigma factor (sigma-70 family)
MRDHQRLAAPPERQREALFTQRYNQLLTWALRLTNQHRESAEDLVQDAFIQFALGRTSLEEIENIDGYLRRMLRYMHLSKISRNAQKVLNHTRSIAEYDSFYQRWREIGPPDRMQAQQELCQICAYACSRKETSRAGSVLILRFFHDYYPTEIARVLRSSRHCVDQWQRLARSELKLFLTKPTQLRFVSANGRAKVVKPKLSGVDVDPIGELRQIIFHSRQGECFSPEQLHDIYQRGHDEALTTSMLGHVVSCRSCLDHVNHILGLPLLAERYQGEPREPKMPPQDKTGGGASGGGTIDVYRKRLREVREHKPQELRIAVNGFVASSLRISSECSEFDLNLGQDDKVDFVEIYSDQDVQLLFLSVIQTAPPTYEQWARIELSEGRSLEARLSFESGATLHLTYDQSLLEAESLPAPLKIVNEVLPVAYAETESVASPSQSRLGRLFQTLKLHLQSQIIQQQTIAENSDESDEVALMSQTLQLVRKHRWNRPALITAFVSLLLIGGATLFFKNRISPVHTAASLLEQASIAEEMSGQQAGQVTHRLINLAVSSTTDGAVIARRRIEIWQKVDRMGVRRLYDERNRLVAASWEKADGSRTVYHHGSKLRQQTAPESPDQLVLDLENIWQLKISAKEFKTLIAMPEEAQVEESQATYLISYGKQQSFGASTLLKTTLALSRTDLHTVELTLVVKRGGTAREYRFIESSFEKLPEKDVASTVFEIEPELLSQKPKIDSGKVNRAVDSIPTSSLSLASPVASTELEVDVAYLLNQVNGARSEQVALSRTANGLLRVEGVVESEERKLEFLRALEPIRHNPAVKIEIGTIAEALKRQQRPASGTFTVRDTVNTVAVYYELRNYFARGSVSSQSATEAATSEHRLDEVIRSFSSRAVNRAYRVLFHAIELRRLVNRFAGIDMRLISPDAREKWLKMVRENAAAFEHEIAVLRQEIQPIFLPGQPSNAITDEFEITSDGELTHAIERLHKLALENNGAIREAFTISSQSSGTAIKSSQFWRSLTSAESLAASIKQYRN